MGNCRQLDEFLDRGSSGAMPEALRLHLVVCPRCRKLHKAMAVPEAEVVPPAPLVSRVASHLAADLKPVTPVASSTMAFLRFLAVSLLVTAALLGALGMSAMKGMSALQLAGFLLLTGLAAAALAATVSWQISPGSRYRWSPAAMLGVLVGAFLLEFMLLFPWQAGEGSLVFGWKCARAGVVFAIPSAFLLWLAVRRGEPPALGTLGATIGGAGALISLIVLQFNCSMHEAAHLSVGHASVLGAGIGLGFLTGWACEKLQA
ncbi:MAG: DUF1109 domain-containing protein [Acidimicrobiia bacterium]|nr:DUF1109 domain-containing protein [Acidimicrobiia bacterium]